MPEIYKKDQKYNIIYSDQDGKDNEYKFTPEEDMSKPEMIMKCKEANKNFIKLKEIKKLEEGVHKMEETKKLETLADIIRDRYEKGLDGLDVGDNTVDMIVYFDYNPEDLDNYADTFTKCLDTIATGTKVVNYDEEGAYAVVDFYNYVIDHLNAFTNNFTINIDPADGEDNETIAANIVEGILPGLISGYTNDHTYNSLDTDLLMGVQKKEESFEDSKKFMAGEILAIIDNYINSDDIPNLFDRMGITQEIYEGDEEIPEGKIQDIIEIGLEWLFEHLQPEDYKRVLKDDLEMTDEEMEKYGIELDESKKVEESNSEIEAELEKYKNQGFSWLQLVEIQKGLKCGLDISKYADLKFECGQMEEIRKGLEHKVDISKYDDPKYDSHQMQEIRLGLEDGLDVSKYADLKYTADQMSVIRNHLEAVRNDEDNIFKDADIFKYVNSGFNSYQIIQIRLGLNNGVDVSKYADPKIFYGCMREIRKGLENGVDVSKYANLSEWKIQQIRLGLENGVDVSKYADPTKYTSGQIEEIRKGLENGVDISKYNDPKFNDYQMCQIRLGLEDGLDVSKYADLKYTYNKMQQIRLGLENGVDVSKYDDPKYTAAIMNQIRLGLEDNIDITPYINYKSKIEDIKNIKYALTHGFIPEKAKK